ncbi:hypothetical protein [Roseimicrobium sp. ORNL1]|uniref:hypothetical protein n=1 Tax=Roseimicrobium sp. ORNL1 TaxID=2711231 RepID=UPI0013E18237|nr:hypothetical protein [Roseimicrobium sp. ORNL1]QIF03797.1 hypothetical protein G5S37_20480 [Roseimicrobium sp. ORNL1]
MHLGILAFDPFGTGGMMILAVVILVLGAGNYRAFVRSLSKNIADFKKARDDFEDRHGL